MTIEELQQMYERVVGRPSGSQHRGYLQWKIREAEKGRIRTGALPERRKREPGEMQVIPFQMKRVAVPLLDAAWKAADIPSRNRFITQACMRYLKHLGQNPGAIFDETDA